MANIDLGKYCQVMEEVKRRKRVIEHFLVSPQNALYEAAAIESSCLQVRKILELVALGSLVANQDNWNRSLRELRNAWNASDIFKELRKVNPDFFPKPVVEIPLSGAIRSQIIDRTDDFLTEEEFAEAYGRIGEILHAGNPMGTPIDYNHWKSMIPHWMNQTVKLLNPHQIRVLGNPNMFLIHMNDASDGTVRGYEFQPLA